MSIMFNQYLTLDCTQLGMKVKVVFLNFTRNSTSCCLVFTMEIVQVFILICVTPLYVDPIAQFFLNNVTLNSICQKIFSN